MASALPPTSPAVDQAADADQAEVAKFRTSFEEKKTSREDLLEQAVTSLKTSNDLLKTRLDEVVSQYWWWPKMLFICATCFVAGFFGVNLWTQYTTIAGLDATSKKLQDELKSATESRKSTEDELVKIRSEAAKLHERVELGAKVDAASHQIITLVTLGRTHLSERNNPQSALEYASLAEKRSRELQQLVGADSRLDDVRDRLLPLIWVLEADAAWQGLGAGSDFSSIARVDASAEKLLRHTCPDLIGDCDRTEGCYFKALATLHHALRITNPRDQESRASQMKDAKLLLEACMASRTHRSLAALYLAAVCFETGEYRQCGHSVDILRSQFHAEDVRLDAKSQAQLALGKSFGMMSDYVEGNKKALHAEFDCNLDAGAIGAVDAQVLEELLVSSIRRRNQLVADPRDANALGLFAGKMVAATRRLRFLGNCEPSAPACADGHCGAGPEHWRQLWESVPDEFVEEFSLKRWVDNAPALTSDRSLGVEREGNLWMTIAEIETREFHSHSKSGEIQRSEVEVLTFYNKAFGKDDVIPEGRYVKFTPMHSAPAAPAAPEAAPAPPPEKKPAPERAQPAAKERLISSSEDSR